jgi:hypothetical protein
LTVPNCVVDALTVVNAVVIAVPTYDCVAILAGMGKFDSWLPSPINALAVIEDDPNDKLPGAMFDKSDFNSS